MAKIAFLLRNDDLIPWLKDEIKAFPYEALFGADKPVDAYVVLAEAGDVEEFLQLVEGHMFSWFGDGAERAATLSPIPFHVEGDWEKFTADDLVNFANAMHESIEEERRKRKEAHRPERPGQRPTLLRREQASEPNGDDLGERESFGYDVAFEEAQVIAVGGHGGASFVAWNLAAIAKLPLIEGRKTGSLSKWIGDETPVSQALDETLPYGTVSDGSLPKSIVGRRVVVDTGPDANHPVFKHARIRIWVTTLDPAGPPVPERSKVVVNRVPDHLPFEAREVVGADVALQVPESGLDVLLSLFTHIPWITKQDHEVQEQWKALIRTGEQKGGAEIWDDSGW